MPAKTGKEYIERLKKANNNVYIHGERVDDVTEHPAFKNVIQSMARLYDLQYEKPDKMLYTSPTTGDKVGMTFKVPETIDDLIARREAIQEWARTSGGMMGRSPDYMNAEVMAAGAAHEFFAQGDPMFAENAKKILRICTGKRPQPDAYTHPSASEPGKSAGRAKRCKCCLASC